MFCKAPLTAITLLLLGSFAALAGQASVSPALHFDSVPEVKFETPKIVQAPRPAGPPRMVHVLIMTPPPYFARHLDQAGTVLRTPPLGRPAGPGWGPGVRP